MRYLVKARVKRGQEAALLKAIDDGAAARQGLKMFEDEFSEPAIVLH